MIITYHGIGFFKVQFGNIIVAVNPVSKDSKTKASKFGSDITLISANHPDMNGAEQTTFGEKTPFTVKTPGEYEIKETIIKGFASRTSYGGKEIGNTVFLVSLENMNLCFLGAFGEKELSDEAQQAIDDIDVLFLPIGGEGTLDPAGAAKVAASLEPKIIIPSFYDISSGTKNALNVFLKEGGEDKVAPVDKLTIKKKDVIGKEGDIIVLSVS